MEILKYSNILNLIWIKEVNISMMFMIAFWVCIIIAFFLWLLNLKIKDKKLEGIVGFFIFIQFLFMIVAIGTKDPIFQAVGLPQGYEWIAGLSLSGFSLWLFYLSPLKNRVIEVEKDTSSIKTSVLHIEKDIDWIKENCKIAFKK
jgi:hypothetical protein